MRKIKNMTRFIALVVAITGTLMLAVPYASANAVALPVSTFADSQCGSGKDAITTSINFGCNGAVCPTSPSAPYCTSSHNAMIDLTFAIIRFLSDGVGLIIIASVIIAGIQYTFSRGEPQSIANASKRIQSSVTALLIFIFAYALLNYIIPNGFLGQ